LARLLAAIRKASIPNSSINTHRFKGAIAITNGNLMSLLTGEAFPYSFIDGKFGFFVISSQRWREANNKANTTREIYKWSETQGQKMTPMLLMKYALKILPRSRYNKAGS